MIHGRIEMKIKRGVLFRFQIAQESELFSEGDDGRLGGLHVKQHKSCLDVKL